MSTDYKAMLESTSNHQPTVSNPLEHVVSCDYVLELDKDRLTVEQLKPLIGMELPVLIEGTEWRKVVVKTDKLIITSVNVGVDIFSDSLAVKSQAIYCDFYLKGKRLYNAWLDIKRIQAYIMDKSN